MTAEVERPSWSRPPFAVGNDLAVRHGAFSARVQGERAAAVLAELKAVGPEWLGDVDSFQLESWAFAEGQCRGLRAWLSERSPLRPDGKPWPASDELLKWERRAQASKDALGFNPLARAKGLRDTAVAAAAGQAVGRAAAVGRHLREAHEQRAAG